MNMSVRNRTKRKTRISAFVGAFVLLLAAVPVCQAELVTFANFSQVDSGNQWTYSSGSYPGTASFTANLRVQFQFLEDLDGSGRVIIGQDQLAMLSMSAVTSTAALQIPLGLQTLDIQPLDQLSTISIRRLSDNANLLTISFTGDLSGLDGTSVGSLRASSAVGSVIFSSDFLDFSDTDERGMSLSFSSIQPLLALNGISGASFMRSFMASGTGTFDAQGGTSVVPEPATFGLLGLGALSLLGYGWRRRQAA